MSASSWRTRPVVGIGIVGLDHVAVTDRWEEDTKSAASHYFEQVGGPVPVALMAMARLGIASPPRFVGRIGDDDAGQMVWEQLIESGIDTAALERVSDAPTGHSLVVLQRETGTRALTSFTGIGSVDFIPASDSSCSPAGLIHCDGRFFDLVREAKRATGALLSLDLGSMRPGRERFFACADIVLASQAGAAGAFPDVADDPLVQTHRFLDKGATVAGVTLGANGVMIGCRNENHGVPVHLPAFSVPNAVDTCGAGDLFHGAFLWAYREGRSVIESATFAQAAVAIRVQTYGNRAGQPTREQVESFLAAS